MTQTLAQTECEGHPAGPFDPMGQTVYCDGSCRDTAEGIELRAAKLTAAYDRKYSRDNYGRFAHEWGWQGYDANGHEWATCSHCALAQIHYVRDGQVVRRRFRVRELPELRPSPEAWAVQG